MKKFLIQAALRFFAIQPLWLQRANARFLAWLFKDVIKYRLKVVRENIALAFPEKTPQEHKAIVDGFYRHLGTIFTDAVWFGGTNRRRLNRRGLQHITNLDELNALSEKSGSIVVLYPHNCNWEIIGGLSILDETLGSCVDYRNSVVVYKQLSDPVWDEIFARNRSAALGGQFDGYVESKLIVRYMFTHTAEKKMYYLGTDQYPYGDAVKAIPVKFMGRDTYTMTAGAAVAAKFGYPVVYLSMMKTPQNTYEYTFKTITEKATKEDIPAIMDKFYALLEEDIRKKPETYLWSHRRWKNRI